MSKKKPQLRPDHLVFNAVADGAGKMSILPGDFFQAASTLGGPGAAQKMTDKTLPPTPIFTDNGNLWAWWGADDRRPTKWKEKVNASPIAGATLARKVAMLLGDELVYFKNADLRKGGNKAERHYDQRVEDFLSENRIQTEWFPAQCADFSLYLTSFSELVKSTDGNSITNLFHLNAEATRLSKINKLTRRIEYLVYSYEFEFYNPVPGESQRVAIPLFRWYERDFHEWLRSRKFAWHTRFPTPGLIYYPDPWWTGLFKEDGWLDVSAQVPTIVSSMQKNQVSLKYLILVPEAYFELRHPNWQTYEADKRDALIKKQVAEWNTFLTKPENQGKSLVSLFKTDMAGNPMGKIEIIAVDDKTKSGTWVPDSNAADAQIVQGFGQHPSQIGLSPEGGKMGAGSGSDQRETYNLGITLNTPEQRLLLEPLNYVSKYNGWGVTFQVAHTHHTTTNDQESGMVPNNRTTTVTPPEKQPTNQPPKKP